MEFEIIEGGDVFECSADALVFSASKKPIIGGNFDGRVFSYADSEKLLAKRKEIGEIQSGNAEITESFGLKGYKYLIHTVMPNYNSSHYNPSERLKNCYINSLVAAENYDKANIKSVVFPVLGGGCAKFPSSYAKELAIQVLNEYQQTHTESCIEKITLVLYGKRQEYHDFVTYNEYIRKLSELNVSDKYFNQNSSMNKRMVRVSDKLIEKVKAKTDRLYLQYQQEIKEFIFQSDNGQDGQIFNDELYIRIFEENNNMTNEELAERIDTTEGSDISKYKKCNSYLLKNRYNIIRLGLGLELCLDDFCRLIWSRGHIFPQKDLDYILIEDYIEKGLWLDALYDYSYELTHNGKLEEISNQEIDR